MVEVFRVKATTSGRHQERREDTANRLQVL